MAEAKTETPKKEETLDLVKRGLRETIGLTQEEVDELPIDAVLDTKIGMDELDKVEFCMWVEEEIDRQIGDEESENAKTLGDWVKLVEAKLR
jgi:acyl carrier protein